MGALIGASSTNFFRRAACANLEAVCCVGFEVSPTATKGFRQGLKEYALILKGFGMTLEGRAIGYIGGG